MAKREVKTYCRFCHAYCPMIATVDGNRLLGVRPDTDNEVYGGYTCIKGRQLPHKLYHPNRLKQSLKRDGGEFAPIAMDTALDEIASRLQDILERHGPRSIASYNGTYSFQNSAAHALARAWHRALGSPSYYTSVTIDQPAKVAIGPARMGWFGSGAHCWGDADVSLIIGNNTLVSHFSIPGGIPSFSPANALREGRKRGVKVICMDPRESEVAKRSDLHLQVKPGHDAAVLAAMINVIIAEGLYDADFVAEHCDSFDALRDEVSRFEPAEVAAAAGIAEDDLLQAARIFGSAKRGSASTGTGPEMGPHPNLVQHMVQSLNAICGRYYREGERVPNPGVLTPPAPRLAQAFGPQPGWLNDGPRSRVSDDIGEISVLSPYGPVPEMPTAVISDEILEPGEGQIRALICVGGNPLLAWPDQDKARRALESLELLVCIDTQLSATAQLADYVLSPKICLEREDVTLLTDVWHERPYSQYTEAVVEAEGDKIEEWEFFWETGRRMGLSLELENGPLDMAQKPSKFDLLANITRGSRVPLQRIRDADGGTVFPVDDVVVQAADEATRGRLQLMPEGVEQEFAAALSDLRAPVATGHPLLLVSRRMKYNYNTSGREYDQLRAKRSTNPAYVNPAELEKLGIADGEIVQLRSAHGCIPAVACAAPDVRPGVVSMAHCWGGNPAEAEQVDSQVREIGACTNRLVDNDGRHNRYSGMARQSCIPVTLERLESREAVAL